MHFTMKEENKNFRFNKILFNLESKYALKLCVHDLHFCVRSIRE